MLLNKLLILLIYIIFTSLINGQVNKKFFRKDYKFIEESQSFYKIHTLHRSWLDAKKRCALEGATLFYPEDKFEADAVLKFWNQTQPLFHWVFIGISGLIAKGVFETIDGIPITDVYNNWRSGEPNDKDGKEDCLIMYRDGTLNDDVCGSKFPFICKKTLVSLEWNLLCDMPDPTYVYNSDRGKCYKFHLNPMNWTDAYTTCAGEQAYLAVVNSRAEADLLVNITAEAPKSSVTGNYLSGAVYLGFHNMDGEGWKTIKGTTLEESGYSAWGNQQPDGGDLERCGSMFYNSHLNDLECSRRCFFICERDIALLGSAVDERFSH